MNPNFNNNNQGGPPQRPQGPGGPPFFNNPNQNIPQQFNQPMGLGGGPNNTGPNNNNFNNTNNNQQRPFGGPPQQGGPMMGGSNQFNPNQNQARPPQPFNPQQQQQQQQQQQPHYNQQQQHPQAGGPGFRPQQPGPNNPGPNNMNPFNPNNQPGNNMGNNNPQGFNPMGGPGNNNMNQFNPNNNFNMNQFNPNNNNPQQSNMNPNNMNNQQQPPQKTEFDRRLGQIQSIFPAEFRPNETTAPLLFSQGQLSVALVCPTNLTYSFFAHQHLANHGYTAVTSYATHTPLENAKVKKNREGQEPPPRIYGCGQNRPLTESQRSFIFSTYRELLQECEKNQERNNNNTTQQISQQQFVMNSRGLYNILNYAIHPPPTAFSPLIRRRYNITGSAIIRNQTLVKPAPTLFQTALNFTLDDHKRFSSTLHPTDLTNPSSTSFTLTAQNHINWHQNIHRQHNQTLPENQNTNPLGPHMRAETTGEEEIPPFDLIFTYHPQVFTHVLDILQHYKSTSNREIHIINIPTKDDPTDVRLAGELTLELLNALHLSLDRSSRELPSQPMGRMDPTTGKPTIFFKPLDLDGKIAAKAAKEAMEAEMGEDGNILDDPLDELTSPTFEQHLAPFMQHTRGIAYDGFGLDELGTSIPVPTNPNNEKLFGQAQGSKPFQSFWDGSNIEAILTTVEGALGEKLLHCVVWL